MRIERFVAATYGFAVLRRKPPNIPAAYWAIAKCSGGWRLEMGFADAPDDWTPLVGELVGADVQLAAYCDAETGRYRFACYEEDQVAGTIFLAPEPVAVSRDWAIAQLGLPNLAPGKRTSAIAGRPGKGAVDRGATVCACFGVGANEIARAVERGCRTVSAIGEALQAGTNCGSCRAEIRNVIDLQRTRAPTSAERKLVVTA